MSKRLLVLGSNSDVGQACAYRFAQEGYDLLLASRNVDDYQQKLAADLRIRHDVQAETIYFDGHDYASHPAFWETVGECPDIVISVFGYLGDQGIAFAEFRESENIISANYTGHISLLNEVARAMETIGRGTIIGVSSVAGERGRGSNFIYGSAKAGFTAYLSGLRQYLQPTGVHVMTVIPGFIKTKMIGDLKTPAPLTVEAAQVAKAIWRAYSNRKNTVYCLPIWRYIMLIIKLIPEFIFKKIKL